MNVGNISNKKYERRHGLREESGGKKFLKKNITSPLGTALLAVGDFVFKSYVRGKKDMLDFVRLRWSDKHNNYKSGAIPLPFRATLGIGGSMNAVSALIGYTSPGKALIKYRMGRRGRVDRLKQWAGKPFRRMASTISPKLPWYKERYETTQKARQKVGKFAESEARLDSWINGGIRGWLARRKQKKRLRQRENKRNRRVKINSLNTKNSSDIHKREPHIAFGGKSVPVIPHKKEKEDIIENNLKRDKNITDSDIPIAA